MSFQAMAAVIPLQLPTNDKFVLLMLANYADDNGKCWPSINRLSRDTGLSESSVRRCLHSLRDYSGIIAVQARVDSDGRQTSNNFLIDLSLCRRLALKDEGGEGVTQTPPPVTVEGGGCHTDRGEGVRLTPEPISKNLSMNHKPQLDKIELTADGWQNINPKTRLQWKSAYPAISIDQELEKARAWLSANPRNRKSNYERFLVNWFSRAQDSAPRVIAPQQKSDGSFRVAL